MSKYAANAYQYFKSCLCTQIILMHTFEGLMCTKGFLGKGCMQKGLKLHKSE